MRVRGPGAVVGDGTESQPLSLFTTTAIDVVDEFVIVIDWGAAVPPNGAEKFTAHAAVLRPLANCCVQCHAFALEPGMASTVITVPVTPPLSEKTRRPLYCCNVISVAAAPTSKCAGVPLEDTGFIVSHPSGAFSEMTEGNTASAPPLTNMSADCKGGVSSPNVISGADVISVPLPTEIIIAAARFD